MFRKHLKSSSVCCVLACWSDGCHVIHRFVATKNLTQNLIRGYWIHIHNVAECLIMDECEWITIISGWSFAFINILKTRAKVEISQKKKQTKYQCNVLQPSTNVFCFVLGMDVQLIPENNFYSLACCMFVYLLIEMNCHLVDRKCMCSAHGTWGHI